MAPAELVVEGDEQDAGRRAEARRHDQGDEADPDDHPGVVHPPPHGASLPDRGYTPISMSTPASRSSPLRLRHPPDDDESRRDCTTELAPHGLRTTQYSILARLEVEGPMSIGHLAARLAMDRTTSRARPRHSSAPGSSRRTPAGPPAACARAQPRGPDPGSRPARPGWRGRSGGCAPSSATTASELLGELRASSAPSRISSDRRAREPHDRPRRRARRERHGRYGRRVHARLRLRQFDGYRGLLVLADPEMGNARIVTFWDSLEAIERSDCSRREVATA